MESITIVGGGWAGLMVAHSLRLKGFKIQGLEKSNRLGGSGGWVPYEKYLSTSSVDFLKSAELDSTLELVQANAIERRKGNWISPETNTNPLLGSYLESSYYSPRDTSGELLPHLIEKCSSLFQLNRQVAEVHHNEQRIIFSDETEESYEKLIWCAGSLRLGKVLRPANQSFAKATKGIPEASCAFSVEFTGEARWLPTENSVVFPFRHRDEKLVAVGTETALTNSEGTKTMRTMWTVFLDREIAEDREEVAKYVRTLKRELSKEFPELHKNSTEGKISFFPEVHGEGLLTLPSPQITKNLYFVGSELAGGAENVRQSPWDRIIASCEQLSVGL